MCDGLVKSDAAKVSWLYTKRSLASAETAGQSVSAVP